SCAPSNSSLLHARRLPANAVDRLAARLSELAGAPVELERPSDPEHGDYATNIALRTAPQRKQPPRELAAELAARAQELEEIERASTTSRTQAGRSTSFVRRSRRDEEGRSCPKATTRASTSTSSPHSTSILSNTCSRRSAARSPSSASTSTRGDTRVRSRRRW